MKITSKGTALVDGVTIIPGTKVYILNHKDPQTAMQLRVLRDDMGLIQFDEILEGDNVRPIGKESKETKPDGNTDIRGRILPEGDESEPRSKVAERRDRKDKTGKVRRNSRKKTRLGDSD